MNKCQTYHQNIKQTSRNRAKIIPGDRKTPQSAPSTSQSNPKEPQSSTKAPQRAPKAPKRPWVSPRGLLGGAASGRTNPASRVRRVPRRRKHHIQAWIRRSCPSKRQKWVQNQPKVVLSPRRRAYFHVSMLLSSHTTQRPKSPLNRAEIVFDSPKNGRMDPHGSTKSS